MIVSGTGTAGVTLKKFFSSESSSEGGGLELLSSPFLTALKAFDEKVVTTT